jgi:hypothetical protein
MIKGPRLGPWISRSCAELVPLFPAVQAGGTTAPASGSSRAGGVVQFDANGVARLHRDDLVADDEVDRSSLARISADLDDVVARRHVQDVLAIAERARDGFELAGDAGVET